MKNLKNIRPEVIEKVKQLKEEGREFQSILNLNMTINNELGIFMTQKEKDYVLSQL